MGPVGPVDPISAGGVRLSVVLNVCSCVNVVQTTLSSIFMRW